MNTRNFVTKSCAFVALLAVPLALHAATFLPASDEITSLRSETTGDVYAANNSIVIAAPVLGDIFAAGKSVDISGTSSDSVFAVGESVHISGNVGDDVRVAGSMVSLNSKVTHDVFAAGSKVTLGQDSTVEGDAYLAGEEMTISGTINGTLRTAGSRVVITKDAVVTGDVIARGDAPVIEDGATISGKVTTIRPTEKEVRDRGGFSLKGFISSLATLAILGLILSYASPVLVRSVKTFIEKSPLRSGLVGMVWLLLFIPFTLLLLISGILAPVGIFLMFTTGAVSVLAVATMCIATGHIIYKLIFKQEGVVWQHALVGAIVLALVSFLSVFGFVVLLLAFLVAFGALIQSLWNSAQAK